MELNSTSQQILHAVPPHHIYNFSFVIDFSSEKYIVSTGHRNCWYQRRYSEDVSGKTRTCNPSEFIQMVYCIIMYYHFLSVIAFSTKRYTVSTGHRYSWYQQRKYSEDASGETRTRNPCVTHRVLQPLTQTAQSYCWEGVEFIQMVCCIIIFFSFLICD